MSEDELFSPIAGYQDKDGQKLKTDPIFTVLDRLERMCRQDRLSEKQRTASSVKLLYSLHEELEQLGVAIDAIHTLLQPIKDWLHSYPRDPSLQQDALEALTVLWARFEERGKTPPLRLFLHLRWNARGNE